MTLEMQLELQIATNDAVLAANRSLMLPAHRVHVLWHPRGWQVATVRGDVTQVQPRVYGEMYDAEAEAARVSVREDITLCLYNDAGGEMAEMWIDRILGEDDTFTKLMSWMY